MYAIEQQKQMERADKNKQNVVSTLYYRVQCSASVTHHELQAGLLELLAEYGAETVQF